jgi:hypothetical protein
LANYAMVVPLARPIQYRGGGGVVAAPGDATGCRADGCAGPAARRSPNRRAGSAPNKATDRSLVEVGGICARRQIKCQRQRNPTGSKKRLRHVLICSARD